MVLVMTATMMLVPRRPIRQLKSSDHWEFAHMVTDCQAIETLTVNSWATNFVIAGDVRYLQLDPSSNRKSKS